MSRGVARLVDQDVKRTVMLERVERDLSAAPAAAVIWLHGLGADGHDFEPIVPELGLPEGAPIRFVFPHAPVRPVTINAGMRMRAWYDVYRLGGDLLDDPRSIPQDEEGIREAERAVGELVRREIDAGIPSRRIVLAGFSQGGAVAFQTGLRYREPLGGILALSTWLPLSHTVEAERAEENREVPVFLAHGLEDPLVPVQLAELSRDVLERLGNPVEWRTYRMGHAVCEEEIRDIGRWLRRVLLEAPGP